jgi:hypothetical protein
VAVEYANAEMGEDSEDKSESETTDIPISMVMDAQPGDVVRLEIVARDDEGGMATVKYAMPKKQGSSIRRAAESVMNGTEMEV